MAVYNFKQGQFERIADTLEELLPAALKHWDNSDELFLSLRFKRHDDVLDVYRTYVRQGSVSAVEKMALWLPRVKWLVDVETDDSCFDIVLIEDSLPDYLGMMAALQPLIQRNKDLQVEIQQQLEAR